MQYDQAKPCYDSPNLKIGQLREYWRLDDCKAGTGRYGMSLSRRQFVYVASLSMAASAASPSVFAQDRDEAVRETFSDEGVATLGRLSVHDFEWLIGERFSISLAGRSMGKLTLIEATATEPPKPSNLPRTAGQVARPVPGRAIAGFSLRFQGAGGTLPQDTYTMLQAGLGSFPLFLVPEGPGGSNRPTYLAIFTRFADSAPNTPIAKSE
jgi:hypothetical protein